MIRWVSVFIDVPSDRFNSAVSFWSEALAGSPSAPRGEVGQFVTIEPEHGDAVVRMQRFDAGPRTHLDLHVDDVADTTRHALDLGADLVDERGYSILCSPGGYHFCVVEHHGEADRGPRPVEPVAHRAEVLCIDVPTASFDAEGRFWSALTGVDLGTHPDFPEFGALSLWKHGLPWSLLVQQLGDDDPRTEAHAHLDISAGAGVEALAARHIELGARIVRHFDAWTVMCDPAGLEYCITDAAPR